MILLIEIYQLIEIYVRKDSNMATFLYERSVNYYETDQMAIVHHSNYIRWMEETRIKLLEELGLAYDRMEREGVLIPVLSAACEYRIAFRFGDIFQVEVYPVSFNGIKLRLGYRIYNKADGRLHASGETSHCFTDSSMGLLRLKKQYEDIYLRLQEWVICNQEETV